METPDTIQLKGTGEIKSANVLIKTTFILRSMNLPWSKSGLQPQ